MATGKGKGKLVSAETKAKFAVASQDHTTVETAADKANPTFAIIAEWAGKDASAERDVNVRKAIYAAREVYAALMQIDAISIAWQDKKVDATKASRTITFAVK